MNILKLYATTFVPNDYTGKVITNYSDNVYFYKDGKLHREDGPAVIYKLRHKVYYLNNLIYDKHEWFEELTSDRFI
jgi:hypothetical protein